LLDTHIHSCYGTMDLSPCALIQPFMFHVNAHNVLHTSIHLKFLFTTFIMNSHSHQRACLGHASYLWLWQDQLDQH